MFEGTIACYPTRGKGGNARYRGNCAPQFVADYLTTYNPSRGLTIDACEGSGTTGDVCKDLGIPYKGFDLKAGFNSRTMRLRDALEDDASAAFCHPPYAGLIKYSKDVWGNGDPHPDDLSMFHTDIDGFTEALADMLYNIFDALKVGGTYCLLLGLWRHPVTKELVHLPARIFPLAPGTFVNEIVKEQKNVQSGNNNYGWKSFVLTTHETAYVFRKTANNIVGQFVRSQNLASTIKNASWRVLVRTAIRNKHEFTTDEVVNALRHIKTNNRFVRAQIRKQLGILTNMGELERVQDGFFKKAA